MFGFHLKSPLWGSCLLHNRQPLMENVIGTPVLFTGSLLVSASLRVLVSNVNLTEASRVPGRSEQHHVILEFFSLCKTTHSSDKIKKYLSS